MSKKIAKAVESQLRSLKEMFRAEPTRFFTENDVVCTFHRILHEALDRLGLATAADRDGLPQSLIHCEYPTPFRCDMKNGGFSAKNDTVRNRRGSRYRRGHYDVVVLSPRFVLEHTFGDLKAQNYERYKKNVLSCIAEEKPTILYGVEFVYCRDPIKSEKGAHRFVQEVRQDTDKLEESLSTTGFMREAITIGFVKGTNAKIADLIQSQFDEEKRVDLVFAD